MISDADSEHALYWIDARIDCALMRALELGVPLASLWVAHYPHSETRLMTSWEGPPVPGCITPRESDTELARAWIDDSEVQSAQRIMLRAEGIGL